MPPLRVAAALEARQRPRTPAGLTLRPSTADAPAPALVAALLARLDPARPWYAPVALVTIEAPAALVAALVRVLRWCWWRLDPAPW